MNGKWLDEKTERNRWDQDMDSRIREALSAQTGPFEYGNKEDLGREQALRNRVIEQIKEEMKMKHLGRKFKKIAVAAGTMCILGSAVVMAAGHFKGFISSSTALEEFSSYEELEQVAGRELSDSICNSGSKAICQWGKVFKRDIRFM